MSRSIEKKIDLLVEEGYFSEEGIKKEAFKTLLRERSDPRITRSKRKGQKLFNY